MPQMNPIWWLPMMLFFIITLMMINTLIFFYKNYSLNFNTPLKIYKKNNNWKW